MPEAMADWWASLPEYGAGLLLIQFQESPPAAPRMALVGVESSTHVIGPVGESFAFATVLALTGTGAAATTGALLGMIGRGLMPWPLAMTKAPSPGLK